MKIKLQEYGIISIKMIDDMINELEGFKTGDILKDLPTRSLIGTLEGLKQQLITAEKLADVCFEAGEKRGYELPALQMRAIPISESENPNKQDFLNSEIEID